MKFHRETQKFLREVFKATQFDPVSGKDIGLVADGIEGKATKNAKRKAIDKLLEICVKKGWERSEFIKGCIAIRVDDVYSNTFTDWLVYLSPDLSDMYAIPASTKPGTVAVWKKGVELIMGKIGVAVLSEGQHLKMWSRQGAWWSGLKFWWQRKEVDVVIFRDRIVDNKIDREQTHKGQFGINGHSWKGWVGLVVSYWKDVARKIGVSLSEGCIVAQEQYWIWYEEDVAKKNPDGLITCNLINVLTDF